MMGIIIISTKYKPAELSIVQTLYTAHGDEAEWRAYKLLAYTAGLTEQVNQREGEI